MSSTHTHPARPAPTPITAPVHATGRAWTTCEVRVLQQHYSTGGAAPCLRLLVDRDSASIYRQAQKLGLRAPTGKGRPPKYGTTEAIDAAIRRVYQDPQRLRQGAVRELAAALGRPDWWIKRRARDLGVSDARVREPRWTAEEVAVLEAHAHKTPLSIQKALARAGYTRTCTAIAIRRKRLGLDSSDPDRHTARDLARLLGVADRTVRRWITDGLLRAKRRPSMREPIDGGNEYSIHRRDIRSFVGANAGAINLARVDKHWFIDMMMGDTG